MNKNEFTVLWFSIEQIQTQFCLRSQNIRWAFIYTVRPLYKGHSGEPANVAFMGSCPLYTC